MVERLSPESLAQEIATLSGWKKSAERSSIEKSFKFKDFDEAWDFMNKVAALAKSMDHHPEWSNVYNRVDIALSTHDSGGITMRDITLARAIEEI